MTRKCYIFWLMQVACVVGWTGAQAAVRVPSLFGDNMVLQRESTVEIWGWADPGETVRISAGWMKAGASAVAGGDGVWRTTIVTGEAGGPWTMTIAGANRIQLKNVMLGEVWVCSGQSNMEYTIAMLGGWSGGFVADREDLVTRGYRQLRLFTVARDTSSVPLDTCTGGWLVPAPETVEHFSATAYFFGRELVRRLNVPVGLISSSWGGTPAEAWTPRGELGKRPELASYLDGPNRSKWWPATPGILFNAMIHPLLRYAIRGAIWYQGESNRNDARTYPLLMQTLITSWRTAWSRGDFPFYFTQIAPFAYQEPMSASLLREAQVKTLAVPNTGMAVTADIGDVNDIHPKNKQEVGRRLALWALARTYGVTLPAYSGPLYRSMKREGSSIRVSFDHAEGGLVALGGPLAEVEIAGPDRAFVSAQARIDGSTLLVSSPGVPDPAAVRFAFTNTAESRLGNHAGLPASPFRTDDWPVVTVVVTISASYDSARGVVLCELTPSTPGAVVRYTLDHSDPGPSSALYSDPLTIVNDAVLSARAFQDGVGSSAVARREIVRHAAVGRTVTYATPPDSEYPGGGRFGLVDGVRGSAHFRDGTWQGFLKNDLDVTIDLGATTEVREIRAGFLHDQGAWIFSPVSVEYSLSVDGRGFHPAGRAEVAVPDSAAGSFKRDAPVRLQKTMARYVRVTAKSVGLCPPWHPGRGQNAWLFVDEIIVR
jgi:sialate O-acetylesterase